MPAQGETMSPLQLGADEHLFVEVAEEMSLEAYFKAMAIVTKLREETPRGGARRLSRQRLRPGALRPRRAGTRQARGASARGRVGGGDAHGFELDTRIVEIPG